MHVSVHVKCFNILLNTTFSVCLILVVLNVSKAYHLVLGNKLVWSPLGKSTKEF